MYDPSFHIIKLFRTDSFMDWFKFYGTFFAYELFIKKFHIKNA